MEKKRALVTGANKDHGIGSAVIEQFLKADYEVIVVGRNFTNFKYNDNPNVKKIVYDLENLKDIPKIAEEAGPIDVLINNAGVNNFTYFTEYTEEQKNRILHVNLEAPIELIKAFLPYFEKAGKGRVVNVASGSGRSGNRDIWYGITKAGLINLTKSLAGLLGNKGIVVNAVAPGVVDTQWIANGPYKDLYEAAKQKAYTKRWAAPEEVAQIIFWLATDSPEYYNGETIYINGGQE